MSPVLSRLFVLLACAAFAGCSAKDQQQAQQTVQSAALSATVEARLATVDADAAAQVKIANNGGVVTLSGQAHSAQERSAYASSAASVQGVKRVVNNIRVDTQLRGPRESLGDAALAAKVSAGIAAQAGINVASVKPSVRDGVVTLSGTVPSDSVKTTILETVRKTGGVKRVVDRIEVKS